MYKPELRSCYETEVLDDRNVFLFGERGKHLLTGAAYPVLVPLLDGSRTSEEILDAVSDQIGSTEVYYALRRLEDLGYIRESAGLEAGPLARFWDCLGADFEPALRRVRETRIQLLSLAGLSVAPLARSLEDLGLATAPEGDLVLVLTDDYLNPELAAVNALRLGEAKPWMLAKPTGSILWLGPLLIPGRTGCWECLAQRLRNHRIVDAYIASQKHGLQARARSISTPHPITDVTACLLATEVVKWVARPAASAVEGALVTFDLLTLASERHRLTRRPQCPACGGEGQMLSIARPIHLESRRKVFTTDGGHRALPPEETLRRYEHHISPLTGVVSQLRRHPSIEAENVHVYSAGYNAAMKDDTLFVLRRNYRGRCCGKGKTSAQAKASALCEAIERYSGVFQGDEHRISASFRSLGEAAIHPNACMGFSPAQYVRRSVSNSSCAKEYHKVPEPFDEEAEIEWSPVWSLTGKKFRYLPTAYCYFGYPLPPESRFCWSDSNGNAAGNSLEEAVLQGFLELVERDGVALWWYNRAARPGVDLESFDEPYVQELRTYYRSLHREFWVLDMTSDLGIPTFAAVTRRTDVAAEDITVGLGSHLDPRIGILRALTEANQVLPIVLPRHADPAAPYFSDDLDVLAWLRTSTLENRPYLAPSSEPFKRAEDYAPLSHDDLKDDVEACVRIAADRGLEVLVLDQTRADVGMSVVKVLAPGLRHSQPRFAPGRLYDVPVLLGWRSEPLAETDLNPVAIFM